MDYSLNPEDSFLPIEYMGKWWLPENEEKKRFGNVVITPKENLYRLNLLGTFEESPLMMGNKYSCINGIVAQGKGITIFDALCLGCNTSNFNDTDYGNTAISFSEMWIGPGYFNSKEEVLFESYSFGINNLEAWHNQLNFHTDFNQCSIKYDHPNTLPLFEDDYVTISFGYANKVNTSASKASYEQGARISIKSKQGKMPFYGNNQSFQFYSDLIYSFFGLLIGVCPFMFDCIGVAQSAKIVNGQLEQQEETYTRLWHRFLPREMSKKVTFMDIHFPYEFMKEELQTTISRFAEQYKSIDGFGGFVFKLVNSQQLHQYDNSSLPEMYFIFEGVMTALYKAESNKQHGILEPLDEFEKKRSRVLATCPKDLISWLGKKLSPYPVTKDKIAAAFSISTEVFGYISEQQYKQIFNYIKKSRDLYSHGSPERIENWELYIPITIWMRQLITALILNKCDCKTNVVKICYEHNHINNELRHKLPMLLSTLEN